VYRSRPIRAAGKNAKRRDKTVGMASSPGGSGKAVHRGVWRSERKKIFFTKKFRFVSTEHDQKGTWNVERKREYKARKNRFEKATVRVGGPGWKKIGSKRERVPESLGRKGDQVRERKSLLRSKKAGDGKFGSSEDPDRVSLGIARSVMHDGTGRHLSQLSWVQKGRLETWRRRSSLLGALAESLIQKKKKVKGEECYRTREGQKMKRKGVR